METGNTVTPVMYPATPREYSNARERATAGMGGCVIKLGQVGDRADPGNLRERGSVRSRHGPASSCIVRWWCLAGYSAGLVIRIRGAPAWIGMQDR
jgi:hypothetical protein